MQRKLISIFVLLIFLSVVVACASTMTPKKMSASFMATYNSEYKLYCQQVKTPNMTAEQKQWLVKKRQYLIDLWGAIQAYDLMVVEGRTPDPDLQARILNIIYRLSSKGGAK